MAVMRQRRAGFHAVKGEPGEVRPILQGSRSALVNTWAGKSPQRKTINAANVGEFKKTLVKLEHKQVFDELMFHLTTNPTLAAEDLFSMTLRTLKAKNIFPGSSIPKTIFTNASKAGVISMK
ncbi:MAG TPA: hypothetical protein VJH23_02280 [archaeon]|nr:hypothetical protein [archaeon]